MILQIKNRIFTGTEGQHLITKRDYFDSIKDRLDRQYDNLSYDQLVILNEAEKIKSGGFDAVIFSWVKLIRISASDTNLEKLKKLNKKIN
ncbi:MAG: hypothetical protein IPH62_00155 [Ignavibacteriae bacterium]|nr:hypothetical protein [Ignavibacteriota bacterium]